MSTDGRIADLAEVPTDDTLLFRVRSVGEDERPGDEADEREAILLRLADDAGDPTDDVVGWLNVCQHMTHIPLDKGSGAPVRDGEVVCANHGAMFDAASGECTYGPCEGAFLAEVGVTVDEGVRVTGGQYCVGLERDPLALDREGGFGDRLVLALGTARGAVDGVVEAVEPAGLALGRGDQQRLVGRFERPGDVPDVV
ncbi:(2Fe-2S)-binding protein [Halobacteriales archaeon QH_6_68_27]|nr:MAG: (2Fe-2S)-binding protein [Halobacteriales archaeon QH_6_68_27]